MKGPELVGYLPIATTIVALFFATKLFIRYRERGGAHHLWWIVGMLTYAAGTITESLTTLTGWHEPIFRAWYITGALLGGAPLATGTVYLLMKRRNADMLAFAVTTVVVIASWVLCDVYENDLSAVHLGDIADIRLNAYPDKVFHARVSNIGQVLDPNTRTAKVRLDLANPGIMKAGMFVTATFYGRRGEAVALVPATAILHLHDRDWVYLPDSGGKFRRTPVTSGNTETGGMQIVAAGLKPGEQVVRDALQLTTEAQQ